MKFKILITATLDIPVGELREELGLDDDDESGPSDYPNLLQDFINDNLTSLGVDSGETEIGAVEVKKA